MLSQKEDGVAAGPPPLELTPRVDLGLLPVSVALNNEMELITSRVLPGVVSIQVERKKETTPLRPDTKSVPQDEPSPEDEPSVGSGTIVRKDGLVLTNLHVVKGAANSILVTLHGEESARRAKLVDQDETRDLALIQIEPVKAGEEFTALRLGDSSKVRVSHMVLAMGSPWGLRDTVTFGIISHQARTVGDLVTAFFQTSCVINPGNSGGPLVNLQGDVIGIITLKLQGPDEDKAASEGYGLAIPSNEARIVIDNLEMNGPQPYAGLTVEDWPERYWQKSVEVEAVIVKGVTQRAPAGAAGLKFGDVIESVAGERVAGIDAFWRAVRRHRAGDRMKVTVRRDAGAQEFSIALEKMPEAPPTAAPVRGVTLRPLRPMERSMLGFMQPTGLRVEKVDPASPLAGILRPRMNVLHVGGADRSEIVEVATVAEFEDLLDKFASTGGWFITRKPGDGDVAFPPLP